MIMEGCVQWNPLTVKESMPRAGLKPDPLDQSASAKPTEPPRLHVITVVLQAQLS